jgi:hypothetical protein
MNRIKDIIKKNKDFKCVVVTHNKEEFETLRDILVELNFEHSIPFDTLENMMNVRVEEDGYNCCWRISDYMGVCWDEYTDLNESIKYWSQYTSDILEINADGNLDFIE